MQWDQFARELMEAPPGIHIQMGDLFDEAIVPYSVIWKAAKIYREASEARVNVNYVVNRGNHDASRDLEKITAYKIFSGLVGDYVTVLEDSPEVFLTGETSLVVIPWHPVIGATEMVETYSDLINGSQATTAFGHWDVVVIGDNANALPAKALAESGIQIAYTGHDHTPRQLEIDGLKVVVTGSMQPYSFSEDPGELFYVTRSLDQVMADSDVYHDKHLRIRLKPDEVFDSQIDCLSVVVQRDGQDEVGDQEEVEFEPFDLRGLYLKAAEEVGIDKDLTEEVWAKINDLRLDNE